MSHDELSDLLRSMPHVDASRTFTARTMGRLSQPRRPLRYLRSSLAFALSAILLLSAVIGIRHHQEAVRLEQLRSEQQQIRKELEQLKAISRERDAHVFVGSSGSYDFVVGLQAQRRRSAAAQPVSLHIANDAVF